MKRLLLPLVLPGALLMGLGGCSLFQTDNTEPPAELTEIETRAQIETRWSRDTGAGTDEYYLHLRPFVGEGVIVVADAKGRVSAYEPDKGKQLWAVKLKTPLTGGVSGNDEVVVVGTGRGEVIALRRDNGHEIWRQRVTSEVLAFSEATLGVVVARTNDGKLHAMAAGSGEILWQAGRTTPALSLRGAGRPLIAFGAVIAAVDNGKIAAFSLERGSTLWETPIAAPRGQSELDRMVDLDGEMILLGESLYVSSYQGRVVAINLRDGRILWARDLSSYVGLTVDGSNVYITDDVGAVWALDRFNGATMWRQEKLRLRSVTAPAVVGGLVAVGDFEGYVHWLRTSDGDFVARTRIDNDPILVPAVSAGNTAYLLSAEGELAALSVGVNSP